MLPRFLFYARLDQLQTHRFFSLGNEHRRVGAYIDGARSGEFEWKFHQNNNFLLVFDDLPENRPGHCRPIDGEQCVLREINRRLFQ